MNFTALNLYYPEKKRIFFIALTIILIILEELFERVFDKCYCYQKPCNEFAEFLSLLIIPSIISYILALSINETFWKLTTGKSCKYQYLLIEHLCKKSFLISAWAPLVWILIIFLDGDYLACTVAIKENHNNLKGNGTCEQVSTVDLNEKKFVQIYIAA